MQRKNVGVVLAGGTGSRMGTETPKQFLQIAGKTILEHSVDAFEQHPDIHEIVVVTFPDEYSRILKFTADNQWRKVRRMEASGEERYHSTLSAIESYAEETNVNLIFHDAARPLVSQDVITRVINALQHHKAVATVIESRDTVMQLRTDKLDVIDNIPDRTNLRLAQTPQAFHYAVIAEAYAMGVVDPTFAVTDDCSVVRKYLPDIDVVAVEGDHMNFKVTYPSDLILLEHYLQERKTNSG